jgi:hypothetical protein
MMKSKERRTVKRIPIRVLVNCLPPGAARRKNVSAEGGWEMWAQDLGDDGVGLQWSREWAVSRSAFPDLRDPGERRSLPRLSPPPRSLLKKGAAVILDGLVYDDKGARPMRGLIQWARASKDGRTYEFGVRITSPDHRSYFRALAA